MNYMRVYIIVVVEIYLMVVSRGHHISPSDISSFLSRFGSRNRDWNTISTRNRVGVIFPGAGNICHTPRGQIGQCVPFVECKELLEFVRSSNGLRSSEGVKFLRSRICGFFRNSVNVCCIDSTDGRATNNGENTTTEPSTTTTPNSILPTRDECGFSLTGRITAGKEITPGAHPWLTALGYPLSNGSFVSLCGGTLITKRHVLTAAHCFITQPGQREISHARLGEHSLIQNTERREPITLKIEDRKSPGYNRVSHVNDIELLTLEDDIEFTSVIRPACLPIGLENLDFEDLDFIIVGWGDTFYRSFQGSDTPLAANISAVSKEDCKNSYKSQPQVPLDDTQFCAGQGPADACQADSGGPMLLTNHRRHPRVFLVGIISFGVGCANPDFPGVYAFVPEFLPWIMRNIQ